MQLITGSCGGERCINMAVTLREIIKQVQHLEMKLVAGETGLDHEVSWTHMVDSDTISAFLQGQELTFTTGLGLNENLTLLRLVKEVWRNKASGIVINTGPYISEIGQDVIDFANEKGFPVFEVPWRVRMAEIMRIICFAITKEQQNATEQCLFMSVPGRTVCFGTDEKRVFYRQCIYGCECVCSGRQ